MDRMLKVTPNYLAFSIGGALERVWLDSHVFISVRSLSEVERVFFREQGAIDMALRRGFLGGDTYLWNGESDAKELGFYVFIDEQRVQLGAVGYDEVCVPYQRVVELESMIENEKVKDEYVCDVRREIAGLKLPGVYVELFARSLENNFYEGVRVFVSDEYDLRVDVSLIERLVQN